MKLLILFRELTRRLSFGSLLLVAPAFFAGCATGEYVVQTTTAYGERLRIPLRNGAPEPAQEGTIVVLAARLLPLGDPSAKKAFYYFEYGDSSGAEPRSVRVEDVTDDHPMTLLDDEHPKLINRRWLGHSEQLDAASPLLSWVHYLDDSLRVYRFTIVTADGRKLILHQAWSVPAWFKAAMRKTLDMK